MVRGRQHLVSTHGCRHGDAHVGFREGDHKELAAWAAKQRAAWRSGCLSPQRCRPCARCSCNALKQSCAGHASAPRWLQGPRQTPATRCTCALLSQTAWCIACCTAALTAHAGRELALRELDFEADEAEAQWQRWFLELRRRVRSGQDVGALRCSSSTDFVLINW